MARPRRIRREPEPKEPERHLKNGMWVGCRHWVPDEKHGGPKVVGPAPHRHDGSAGDKQ